MLAKRAAPQRAHGAANRVRIIGGQYRRRLLDFPDGAGLRPTPDRVRETLFNWLGQDLPGWACLDFRALVHLCAAPPAGCLPAAPRVLRCCPSRMCFIILSIS